MIAARIDAAQKRVAATPPIQWLLMGFAASYLLFFIVPVFFSGPKMDILQTVVPAMFPIGADLRQTMISVNRLFLGEGTPYIGNIPYPPLVYLVLGPLLLLGTRVRYIAFSLLTLGTYVLQALILPPRMAKAPPLATTHLLVFVSGLLSYGLLFEVERGQFNVIAAVLAYLGVHIFHTSRKLALLAYALFSVSVQLKLYPLVFIVMFIDDWRDWKNNLRRLMLLGAANLALAFVLGPRIFLDFVNALQTRAAFPETIRFDNHSAFSFGRLVTEAVAARGIPALTRAVSLLEFVLPAAIVVCVLLVILRSCRVGARGLNPPLLLVCALAAIMLPPVSHDYTLAILTAPVVLFLSQLDRHHAEGQWSPGMALAVLVFGAAYSFTLFPLGYKPGLLLLQSNFPALLTLLIVTTLVAWRRSPLEFVASA